MNVRELIERLSKADPEALVAVTDSESGPWTDFDVALVKCHVRRTGLTPLVSEFSREPNECVVFLTAFGHDDAVIL